MLKLIRKTADAALDLTYPRGVSCALCGADLDTSGGVLCGACEGKMPRIEGSSCPGCGRRIEGAGLCRMCSEYGPAADRGFAPFSYEGIARNLLIDFKFNDRTGCRELFAYYMIETLKDSGVACDVHCAVPVPMHWRRKFTRGFNQSELLASWIAKEFSIPMIKGVLSRPVYTKEASRTAGGPKQRMESAFGSYRPGKGSLAGKTVLLVDDILTTGSTVRACAAILRQMGAARVYSVVAAAVPE